MAVLRYLLHTIKFWQLTIHFRFHSLHLKKTAFYEKFDVSDHLQSSTSKLQLWLTSSLQPFIICNMFLEPNLVCEQQMAQYCISCNITESVLLQRPNSSKSDSKSYHAHTPQRMNECCTYLEIACFVEDILTWKFPRN